MTGPDRMVRLKAHPTHRACVGCAFRSTMRLVVALPIHATPPKAARMPDRLHLYDTTLRDGQQTQGVQFSTPEKLRIAAALDVLGLDHIEGGWPGANPTDSAFFDAAPQTRATMTAFGMTKRAGRSAENDDVLAWRLNARHAGGLSGAARPMISTSPRRWGSRWTKTATTSAPPSRIASPRAARRCSTPNTFSTATRPIRITRSPACAPPMTRARAGSSCATQMAARCRSRSSEITAGQWSPRGIPGVASASTPTMTPKRRSRAVSWP